MEKRRGFLRSWTAPPTSEERTTGRAGWIHEMGYDGSRQKIAASRLDDLSDHWINYRLPVPVGEIQAELTEHGGNSFSAADAGSGNDRQDRPPR